MGDGKNPLAMQTINRLFSLATWPTRFEVEVCGRPSTLGISITMLFVVPLSMLLVPCVMAYVFIGLPILGSHAENKAGLFPAMTKAQKCRWFRFSLRTLFLSVTVFCGWLGWTSYQVHEREKLINALRRQPQVDRYDSFSRKLLVAPYDRDDLPRAWRFFGAKPIEQIYRVHGAFTEDELRRAKRLLPEANIFILESDMSSRFWLSREGSSS